VDVRLKWAGLFHRKKRTPGKFMMRLKVRCAQGSGFSWFSD
jgi:sulfite reductase beta subunit-like hemoprotein